MSDRNVELNRRWIEAFNRRDIETLIGMCDPAIEFRSVSAAVGGGVYYGHDGMRRWHRDIREAWGEQIRVQPEAYFDLGEYTLLCPRKTRAGELPPWRRDWALIIVKRPEAAEM
jgi:hypothetical protein